MGFTSSCGYSSSSSKSVQLQCACCPLHSHKAGKTWMTVLRQEEIRTSPQQKQIWNNSSHHHRFLPNRRPILQLRCGKQSFWMKDLLQSLETRQMRRMVYRVYLKCDEEKLQEVLGKYCQQCACNRDFG